jgi:hypothetical protein
MKINELIRRNDKLFKIVATNIIHEINNYKIMLYYHITFTIFAA